MNPVHLKTFLLVADSGSFSKASRQLFLNPSALMQQINLLENELGFPLFVRTYSGVALTEAGKEFYAGAKKLLEDMDDLTARCRDISEQSRHRLTIGIYTPSHITELCSLYAQNRPDVELHYKVMEGAYIEDIYKKLKKKEIDLAECQVPTRAWAQKMDFLLLDGAECFCCLFSPANPLYRKEKVSVPDLAGQTVYFDLENSETMLEFERQFPEYPGVTLRKVPYSDAAVYQACGKNSTYIMEQKYAGKFTSFQAVPIDPAIYYKIGVAYLAGQSRTADELVRWLKGQGHS